MIWFFTRESAQVDIEVRRDVEPQRYVLIVTHPDGTERVERFAAASRLVTRVLAVQRRLIRQGWTPSSPTGTAVTVGRRRKRRMPIHQRARRAAVRLQRLITRRLAAALGL
jgi:hypothetical protein